MRIAEIYQSRQGEGRLTGTDSVFVRASGCNLRCWFCDTPFTSWDPEGEDWSVPEILEQALSFKIPHVVVTGGEPMLFAELIPFTRELRRAGKHITIETAGTLYLPVDCDLMSISPKLSNSTPSADRDPRWPARHDRARHTPDVVARLIAQYDYQLKFVVDRPDDCLEVENYLLQIPNVDRRRVQLMPQGTDADSLERRREWLQPYCNRTGLEYCGRKQIEWYGHRRGT